jgi:hypothetical protein
MASTFKCVIGGTDYGPLGENAVTGFSATPSGPGKTGTCTVRITKAGGGGYTITPMMEIQAYMTFDGASGVAADGRLFGGWLTHRKTSQVIGTTLKVWDLTFSDDNLLLDTIVRDAADSKEINLSADTFADQVLALITEIQENDIAAPDRIFDATSGVVDLTSSMPAQILPAGKTLRWYIQALCDTAQGVDSGLRPRFHLGRGTTSGVGDTFGDVVVHIYDNAAASLASPQYTFSTAPTGAEKSVMAWDRDVDATRLVSRRQLISPIGTIFTGADATAAATYSNLYINHAIDTDEGHHMAEPISAPDDSSSSEWQDAIDKAVAATANPRESIRIRTRQPVAVGSVQAFTSALEGLSAQAYRVMDVQYDYPTNDPDVPFVDITLGLRRLQWFEEGDEGIDVPPVASDIVPPAVPTGLAVGTNVILPGGEEARVTLSWAASTSEDVAGYKVRWVQGTRGETVDVGLLLAHYFDLQPELSHNFYVQAYDGHGNHSAFSAAVAATTASRPPTEGLFNPSFEYRNFLDATLPDGWTRAVVANGTAALNTTNVRDGNRSVALTLPASTDTAAIRSRGVNVPGDARTILFSLYAMGSGSISILTVTAYWYKKDDTASATPSTALVSKGAVTTSWARKTYTVLTPPSDAAYVKLDIKAEVVAGTNQVLYVDHCAVLALISTEEVSDDAITDAKLGIITDVEKYELDVTTNPFKLLAATDHRLYMTGATIGAATENGIRISGVTTSGNFALGLRGPIAASEINLTSAGIETEGALHLSGLSSTLPTAAADDWFVHPTHGLIQYDGTRWLGPVQYLHFGLRDVTLATDKVTLSANGHIWYATMPEVGTWWIGKTTWWVQVLTTNSAVSYWTLRLAKYDASLGGAVVLDVNTSALTAGTRRPVEGTANTTFTATAGNDLMVFTEGQKAGATGTPGNLEVFGVSVVVRKVIT